MTARTQVVAPWSYADNGPLTVFTDSAGKNIPAGSVVMHFMRWEGGTTTLAYADDTPGGSPDYQTFVFGGAPSLGIAYCWNHPGGTNVKGTMTLGAARTYLKMAGVAYDGSDSSDPFDVAPAGVTGQNASIAYTASAAGRAWLVQSEEDLINPAPVSPATELAVGWVDGGVMTRTHASGSNTIATTSNGSSLARAMALVLKDPGAGGTVVDLAANAVAQASATASLPAVHSLAAAAAATAAGSAALSTVPAGSYDVSGISIPIKTVAGSDVRFEWGGDSGTVLPARRNISMGGWRWVDPAIVGYYAQFFFVKRNTGTYPPGYYWCGAHPYPCAGTFDGGGDANPLGNSTLTTHFEEIAGMPSADYIESVLGANIPTTKGAFLNWWFKASVEGSFVVHRYWPDIHGHPDKYLEKSVSVANMDSDTPEASAALVWGASFWTQVSGDKNEEPPAGKHFGLRICEDGTMSTAEMQSEGLAALAGTNTAATSKFLAAQYYINDRLSPTDITDKSGAGNHPNWMADSTARPTAFSEIITGPAAPVDLGADATAQAGASATLLKGVSLSGAGLAVAGASASVSHVVPLAASAVAVAVAGAQMALAVQLSGAAIATAAASAGLDLAVLLAADGAAQAGASADLSTNASVDLAAAAQASASASAVLSLTVSLSAAAVGQALASAALAKVVELGADGAAQAGGTAGLQVGGGIDLAAAATAQASAGASLWLDVPLGADALAQALAGGSLSLAVLLGADALASAAGSAAMVADVQLSADGQVITTASAALQVLGELNEFARGMVVADAVPRAWRVTEQPRNFTVRTA